MTLPPFRLLATRTRVRLQEVPMRFKALVSAAAMLSAAAAAFAPPAGAAETTSGYAYTLYTSRPAVDELGQFPPQYESLTVRHVLQGPEHTLIWRGDSSTRDVSEASFALGERRMGLYVPYWQPGKSASDTTGWSEYGHELTYSNFSVKVERAEGEREFSGGVAEHHVLTADYTRHRESDPSSERMRMHSDLWILTDKPFSWAPFDSSGGYSDPRLGAAMVARLGELGMVVRSDARHSSVAVDDDGNEVGTHHEGTWTTWIADLEPAEVPVVNMPVADHSTMEALQNGFREHQGEACTAVMAGSTPAFIEQILHADQQPPVVADLRRSCKRQVMQAFGRSLRENPQSACGDILAGKVPGVVSQALDVHEQKDFMAQSTSFCEEHLE